MPDPTSHRLSFSLSNPVPGSDGTFEILAITSGDGNGWKFEPAVLQKSLSLWDGVHCFIDHALSQRSVKDIAGILTAPTFDETAQGIRATLTPFGPGADLLNSLAAVLLPHQQDYHIGFSADLSFIGSKKSVEEIVKVHSVDLVINPARGGKFIRALNSEKGELMSENTEEEITSPEESPETIPNPITAQLQAQLDEAKAMRKQLATYTLEQMLQTSRLPKPVTDGIRDQFLDRDFTTQELQTAIAKQRQILSDLTAAGSILAHGRTDQMFDTGDRLQAAVDDLFGVPRDPSLQSVQASRLSGIKELYLSLTGDLDFHGGYHPERIQLATTADFTGLVKNALNKLVANTWDQLGKAGYDWWKNISVQEHFSSLQPITGTLIGTVGDLPTVAEGGPYTELVVGDSPETASFTKYGGYIPLTLELIDRDETRKLKAYARELANAGLRKISSLVAAVFTANAGIGPTMADTGALFNTTVVTTAGGHANLTTTALSAGELDIVSANVFKQPMLIKNAATYYGTGPQMAVNPKFLLVPRAMAKTAWEICEGSFVRETNMMYDNVLKGTMVPIIVPEWTDANNWAVACDPAIVPSIFVGERFGLKPEIFVAGDELSPAVFTNDEHRLKVRHFLAVWVNDFRPLAKANVA